VVSPGRSVFFRRRGFGGEESLLDEDGEVVIGAGQELIIYKDPAGVFGLADHPAGGRAVGFAPGGDGRVFLGPVKFLGFYLLTGVAASLLHIASTPTSELPMIGASGAISGILGAYVVLYPKARVLSMLWIFIIVRFIRIPAIIFLGFWFLMQILSAGAGGGVAWWAHIGGFLAGLLCILPFRKRAIAGDYEIYDVDD